MKTLIALIIVSLSLVGCADYKETNEMIMKANTEKFKAFSEGMIGCGDDAACKGMLGMAFASGIGDQKLLKPETWKDWVTASVPVASLFLQGYQIYKGTGNSSGDGITINGDGNSVSGVGNTNTASDNSTISLSESASSSFNYEIANKDYSIGGDTSTDSDLTVSDDGIDIATPTN